ESRVTVLRQDGNRLEQTGLVTGLGVGERIFSVRFIADQGYVVTFRQVDPLYVIDLSNPANPRVTGELKIPGFSSYIHPLAPGYLLTAGRDGDDEGNVGGVKIEIFDVRDPTDPKSVQTAVLGDGWNTWSDVLWDHKAFSYFGARNLLAIPVSGWVETQTEDGWWWGEYKSELALFRVTVDDIEVLPSISHMGFFEDFGGNDHCRYYSGYWQAQIYRGVFIEDYVYSLSQLGLQVHDTRNLASGPVAEMTLLDPQSFPYYDWGWCEGQVVGGDERPTDPAEEPSEERPADGG
ncbi:MAG TPA: beta-propeller domain-containing protein, partial [Myxococcota bacterium]|nr:beta-propeller domain-containing protein [Myxococcota bacterium]